MPVQHEVHTVEMDADIHNLEWGGSALVVIPDDDGHTLTGIDPRGIVQPITEQLIINGSSTKKFDLAHDNSGSTSGFRFNIMNGQDYTMSPLEILWVVYVEFAGFVGWLVEPVAPMLAAAKADGSTSAPTYSSAPFAVIAEMTSTVTARGGNVLIGFTGSFSVQSGDSFDVAIFRDGTEIAGTRRHVQYTSSQGALDPAGSLGGAVVAISTLLSGETDGSHTYDVRWSCAAGTARAVDTQRSLVVLETPLS